MHGIGVPAYNMMPPLPGYDPAVPDWAKTVAGRAPRLWRASSTRRRDTRDSHPLETVLTYPSGGRRRSPLNGSAIGDVADESRRQGADLQRGVEGFLQEAKQQKQPLFYWDAWSGDYPDPFTFLQLFQTGNGHE